MSARVSTLVYNTGKLKAADLPKSVLDLADAKWKGIYQTSVLLVIAYALLFFPLALVCLRASAAQALPNLVEMGRSLGCRPATVFVRVTLPLILPSVAALCLVFVLGDRADGDARAGSH